VLNQAHCRLTALPSWEPLSASAGWRHGIHGSIRTKDAIPLRQAILTAGREWPVWRFDFTAFDNWLMLGQPEVPQLNIPYAAPHP
jgi:hypothetical protein